MPFDGPASVGLKLSVVVLMLIQAAGAARAGWTAKTYPDLRSDALECGDHLPRYPFLCDPDHLLSKEDAESINQRLYELAISTPCQCQRRSQCSAVGPDGNQFYVGFVTTIALVRRIAMGSLDPADSQASLVAERFARAVRNRWALGDCDNSALILIWESHSILHIATDHVTKLYVTDKEVGQIQIHLADLIRRKAYRKALELLVNILRGEYSGAPEEHVDTGTLSLIVSIAVAGILGLIITGCVCAFRCCGNLKPSLQGHSTGSNKGAKRRESIFRQPMTRSPRLSFVPAQNYSPMTTASRSGAYVSSVYGQIDYSVV